MEGQSLLWVFAFYLFFPSRQPFSGSHFFLLCWQLPPLSQFLLLSIWSHSSLPPDKNPSRCPVSPLWLPSSCPFCCWVPSLPPCHLHPTRISAPPWNSPLLKSLVIKGQWSILIFTGCWTALNITDHSFWNDVSLDFLDTAMVVLLHWELPIPSFLSCFGFVSVFWRILLLCSVLKFCPFSGSLLPFSMLLPQAGGGSSLDGNQRWTLCCIWEASLHCLTGNAHQGDNAKENNRNPSSETHNKTISCLHAAVVSKS